MFEHPMYALLNIAVGDAWAGPPDATATWPATMLVDWFRWTRPDHRLTEQVHFNEPWASLARASRSGYFCPAGQFEGGGVPAKRSAIQRCNVSATFGRRSSWPVFGICRYWIRAPSAQLRETADRTQSGKTWASSSPLITSMGLSSGRWGRATRRNASRNVATS